MGRYALAVTLLNESGFRVESVVRAKFVGIKT